MRRERAALKVITRAVETYACTRVDPHREIPLRAGEICSGLIGSRREQKLVSTGPSDKFAVLCIQHELLRAVGGLYIPFNARCNDFDETVG